MRKSHKAVLVLSLLAACASPVACSAGDEEPSDLGARLDVHPLLTGLACPAPPAPGSVALPAPKTPDCQGRDSGWFCSDNVKNSAIHCKGGAVDTGAFCADPDQKCKKTAPDDWTANVSASGEVTCE